MYNLRKGSWPTPKKKKNVMDAQRAEIVEKKKDAHPAAKKKNNSETKQRDDSALPDHRKS